MKEEEIRSISKIVKKINNGNKMRNLAKNMEKIRSISKIIKSINNVNIAEYKATDSPDEYLYDMKWWAYGEYQKIEENAKKKPVLYGKEFKKIADELFEVTREVYVFYMKEKKAYIIINEYEMDKNLRNKDLNILELKAEKEEEYYICIDEKATKKLFKSLRKSTFKKEIQNIFNGEGFKRMRHVLGYFALSGIEIENVENI